MKWISVIDKKPIPYKTILIFGIPIGDNICESCESRRQSSRDDIFHIYFGIYEDGDDGEFMCHFNYDVIRATHWMPLPGEPQQYVTLEKDKIYWRNTRTGQIVEDGTLVTISEIDDWVKVETEE